MTRAIAIMGRANEMTFVAASQTPWWELTRMMGVSVFSRSSFAASGLACEKSRWSRQLSSRTTDGTRSASQMWPGRWHHAFFAILRAAAGSFATPARMMLSMLSRLRFGKSGHTSAASAYPMS